MNTFDLNLSMIITQFAAFLCLHASGEKDPNGSVDRVNITTNSNSQYCMHIVGMFAHNDCLPS
jgi:hypothetical protein